MSKSVSGMLDDSFYEAIKTATPNFQEWRAGIRIVLGAEGYDFDGLPQETKEQLWNSVVKTFRTMLMDYYRSTKAGNN